MSMNYEYMYACDIDSSAMHTHIDCRSYESMLSKYPGTCVCPCIAYHHLLPTSATPSSEGVGL